MGKKSAKTIAMEAQARFELAEDRREARQAAKHAVKQATHVVKTARKNLAAVQRKALHGIYVTSTHWVRTPADAPIEDPPPRGVR